jgi:hypothetical protein
LAFPEVIARTQLTPRGYSNADGRNLTLIDLSDPGTGTNNEEDAGYFKDRQSIIWIDAAEHVTWEKRKFNRSAALSPRVQRRKLFVIPAVERSTDSLLMSRFNVYRKPGILQPFRRRTACCVYHDDSSETQQLR